MSSISIIGSGTVGYAVGAGFQRLGCPVLFFDIDDGTIGRLRKLGHEVTERLEDVVDRSDISFICVPTQSGTAGLTQIVSAIKTLAKALRMKHKYHLVVIKSTVVPTTTEHVLVPLLLDSGRSLGSELGVCVNPEFGTQAASTWTDDAHYHKDFFSQDRIVIGECDRKSGDILEQLYKPLGKPIFRTNLRTAEMIKCTANCMLATKVSFWNEVFLISQELGIDSQQVADIVTLDPRIGRYGSVHGKAFGGTCLPKDLEAFISFAEEYRNPVLLRSVKQINDYMMEAHGVRGALS